jgi:3'-phosphoadenosine 5'-phosphosulfate sulfotransferase (PAPS reductase)/FAD synthetase
MKKHVVSWFSAGVSSAVATKLAAEEIDQILYTHIDDQHEDTLRFVKDCEVWFGVGVKILRSDTKTVEDAISKSSFINSPYGASCTRILKRQVRQQWERENVALMPIEYVWGFDTDESDRADLALKTMPEFSHRFPLIEKRIGKQEAHEILRASGIRRPAMYALGYQNNNCIGCVKGGMGYWNKIRVDFPSVFDSRAKLERRINASCINGVFLDELHPEAGRNKPMIMDECGLLCELQALPPSH